MRALKNLIICGCYRSGTSIASIMLSHHPELLVTDELWYFYRDRREWNFNEKIKLLRDKFPDLGERPFIPYNMLGDRYVEFLDLMLEQYPNINHDTLKDKLLEYSGRKALYYGDKVPEYTFELDNFTQLHDAFKTIICIRDPRDVICSQLRRYKQYTEKYGTTLSHWWCKSSIEECFSMERNWLSYMETWENTKGRQDGYELNYTSLVEEPIKEAGRIADFLNISKKPMEDIILDLFKPSRHQEWKTVCPDITNKLPSEWKDMMERRGLKI